MTHLFTLFLLNLQHHNDYRCYCQQGKGNICNGLGSMKGIRIKFKLYHMLSGRYIHSAKNIIDPAMFHFFSIYVCLPSWIIDFRKYNSTPFVELTSYFNSLGS